MTVPVPLHDPLRRGTSMNVVRQPQLPRSLFETANYCCCVGGAAHPLLRSKGGRPSARPSRLAVTHFRLLGAPISGLPPRRGPS